MNNRWTHSNKAVYNLRYHLVWCPKYRKSVLINDIPKRLECILKEKASQIDLVIESIEILPDHVHLFVKSSPLNSPHYIVQQLKGVSSRLLRKEFPNLRKIPTLWTRAYYCESVGHISGKTIKKYIEEQRGR